VSQPAPAGALNNPAIRSGAPAYHLDFLKRRLAAAILSGDNSTATTLLRQLDQVLNPQAQAT
jgi:hypothetical protein